MIRMVAESDPSDRLFRSLRLGAMPAANEHAAYLWQMKDAPLRAGDFDVEFSEPESPWRLDWSGRPLCTGTLRDRIHGRFHSWQAFGGCIDPDHPVVVVYDDGAPTSGPGPVIDLLLRAALPETEISPSI